jgi:hypothetical protein
VGAGARIDVIFNITDFDYNDQDHGPIHRFNIPSCGLRAGIRL